MPCDRPFAMGAPARSGSCRVGPAGGDVRPDLAVYSDRWRCRLTRALGGRAVTVRERGRLDPRLERSLVAPSGDDEPRGPLVVGAQQLEALESVLIIDG